MPVSKKPRKKASKSEQGRTQNAPLSNLEICFDFMDKFGLESDEFQAFFTQIKKTLLIDDTVAFGLVHLSAQDDCDEDADFLFNRLLDEASMDVENDGRYGAHFISTVEMAIETGMEANAFSSYSLMIFGGAFHRAGLPVPYFLKMDMPDTEASEVTEGFDPDTQLANLEKEVLAGGGTAYDVFCCISEMSAISPNEVMAALANYVTTMEGALFERCALYFLLSEDADVRIAAASGLYERLEQSRVAPETLAFLPIIRGWLPSEPSRDCIDAINQKARRKSNMDQAPASNPAKIFDISASITDGVGAQSIAISVERDGGFYVAMLLTKHGYGVKDAFVVPCASQKEAQSFLSRLRDETYGSSVALGTLQIFIESALADGLENEKIPAPGILDVLEICNLQNLRPQIVELSKLLDFVDPEKSIQNATPQALGRWINDEGVLDLLYPLTDCWFEDNAETRQSIMKGGPKAAIDKRIWKYLEGRRDIWARRFLQTAAMCHDSDMQREWKTLTASAHGLMIGRSLKRIPLMDDIVHTTLAASGQSIW